MEIIVLFCQLACSAMFVCSIYYIYIFIAIALHETSILVAIHFSMKNINQSCDLGCAMGQTNIDVSH